MSSPAIDTTSDDSAFWSDQAGRLMRTNLRQTWLVPLLAVPLSHVALSPCLTTDFMDWCLPKYDHGAMRRDAVAVSALAHAVAASDGIRPLSDDEAWLLLKFNHDYVGLAYACLMPSTFLMIGMEILPGLPVDPLLRRVAEWVSSGAFPVPMAAFITARALQMIKHRPMFLPKIDGGTTRSSPAPSTAGWSRKA